MLEQIDRSWVSARKVHLKTKNVGDRLQLFRSVCTAGFYLGDLEREFVVPYQIDVDEKASENTWVKLEVLRCKVLSLPSYLPEVGLYARRIRAELGRCYLTGLPAFPPEKVHYKRDEFGVPYLEEEGWLYAEETMAEMQMLVQRGHFFRHIVDKKEACMIPEMLRDQLADWILRQFESIRNTAGYIKMQVRKAVLEQLVFPGERGAIVNANMFAAPVATAILEKCRPGILETSEAQLRRPDWIEIFLEEGIRKEIPPSNDGLTLAYWWVGALMLFVCASNKGLETNSMQGIWLRDKIKGKAMSERPTRELPFLVQCFSEICCWSNKGLFCTTNLATSIFQWAASFDGPKRPQWTTECWPNSF